MSSESVSPPAVSATAALPWPRWLLLVALFCGEILLLTMRFDTETLYGRSEWWAELLGESHLLPRLFLVVAAATLLLGGASLRDSLRCLSIPPLSFRTTGAALLAHLLAFVAFAFLTRMLLEYEAPFLTKSSWTIVWLVVGLATAGFWALTLLPIRLWLQLFQGNRLVLVAGLTVGILAWSAGLLLQRCWMPLAEATLWTVHTLLRLTYSDIVCQPDERIIGTSTFAVGIAPECSGYEGMGLLSVFMAAYLWLFRRDLRFPQALLLWPAGVVVLWLTNSFRIAALIGIGTAGWPDIALGGFHSQAGWLAFNTVALGLAILARRLRFFAAEPLHTGGSAEVHPATAYLAPFLAILATTMLTGAFSAGFDVLYPLRVVAAGIVLYCCRRAYTELRWSWSWQPFALGLAVFVLWIALVPSGLAEPSSLRDGLARLSPSWAAFWLLCRIAGATLTVPLAEELAFRGYLLRRLQSPDWDRLPPGHFSWMSVLISSLLFGVMHGSWLAGTLAGLAYAVAVYRRGNLLDAVLAHATTNALLAVYVLATGAWTLW